MDDAKKAQRKEIFRKMNSITSRAETRNVKQGNTTISKIYLVITVIHKSVDEIAKEYGFSKSQKASMNELLSSEYDSMWSGVIP